MQLDVALVVGPTRYFLQQTQQLFESCLVLAIRLIEVIVVIVYILFLQNVEIGHDKTVNELVD